jgi:aromatic ring-opening dioxygenase catalytic subunit (LigB family)
MLPTLIISHGSPMLASEPSPARELLVVDASALQLAA